jgi:glycosyltransferase involved in cell wall biosynthesis
LRIAVDALGLPPIGGAKTSALGWLAALGHYDQENEYTIFLSHPEEALSPFPHMRQRIVPLQSRFVLRAWAQLWLPRFLAREKVDLLHGVKNLGILGAPCPTLITVNDLSHVTLRELYSWADGVFWQLVQPQILRHTTRIIAISESTKHELVRAYGLNPARIVTIYPSCDDRFHQPCDQNDMERVRIKYGLPDSMFLYVGGLGIHKNVTTLVRAFSRIADQVPHGLVLVGGAFHTNNEQNLAHEVAALGLADRVWQLGPVSQEDLPALYHMADLFLLASLNEGFGLVLLEAMACGTPVIAARRGGVPEAVGCAGWLLDDPRDDEGFAKAIGTLLTDRAMLAEMGARGVERSQDFSWKRTAARTLALYRELANG